MVGEISPPRPHEIPDCYQFMQELKSGEVDPELALSWEEEDAISIEIQHLAELPATKFRGEFAKRPLPMRPHAKRNYEGRLDSTKSLFHIVQS